MVRGIVFAGLLLLLCQQAHVDSHVLSRPSSTNSITKLKSLLEQLEEALGAELTVDGAEEDYKGDDLMAEQGQQAPASPIDRGAQNPAEPDDGDAAAEADEAVARRNRLLDFLMAPRSKTFSGCFGGRLDRIGSSSGLGCNSKKG